MLKSFITAALRIAIILTIVIFAARLIGGVLDENYIAYDMPQSGSMVDLWLIDVERARVVNLTRTHVTQELSPAWSPDGRFILYNRYTLTSEISMMPCVIAPFEDATPRCFDLHSGTVYHAGWDASSQIVYINLFDLGRYAAVNAITGEVIEGGETTLDREWSAYSADRRTRIGIRVALSYLAQLWVQETEREWMVYENTYLMSSITLSPDGTQIVFAAIHGTDPDIELYRISTAEGSTPVQLTFNRDITDESPTWSRDGEWIAFRSDRDGGVRAFMHLYLIRPDGSETRRLTFDAAQHGQPAWRP